MYRVFESAQKDSFCFKTEQFVEDGGVRIVTRDVPPQHIADDSPKVGELEG